MLALALLRIENFLLALRQNLDKNQNLDKQINSNVNKEFLPKNSSQKISPKILPKNFSQKIPPEKNQKKIERTPQKFQNISKQFLKNF